MPPHIKKNQNSELLDYWRTVWGFFIENKVPLFPTYNSVPVSHEMDYLILSPETSVKMHVPSIAQFIAQLGSLYNCVYSHSHNYNTINTIYQSPLIIFEWNYLGLASERDDYLRYLSTFFWMNQTEFESVNEYSEIVAQPWLCLKALQKVPNQLDHQLASDYFSPKSLDFVQMVTTQLPFAEYNPYVIHSDKGSFQWQLTIEGVYRAQGILINEDAGLKHIVDIKPLTEIVI